ncbi:hypothetical protein GUJ93_ZPchr0013g34880 [Zizania palustris]|uniref:AP2/ERF domain-containing protein n=1 Tax=Zizania palustris TaxID=103762 RepID=A0A8J6C5P1_ZIZPA|nr:hypothetical protein GUJ93_ZPchr0013g34880 [Zizania palustris]
MAERRGVVRIIYRDEDATDSSSEEEEEEGRAEVGARSAATKRAAVKRPCVRHGPVERKFMGVRQRPWGKWAAEIRNPQNRSRLWLGTFNTAAEAAAAYDDACVRLRGPGAAINFPSRRCVAPAPPPCDPQTTPTEQKVLFPPPLPPKKKALFPPPLPPKKKALFPPPLPPKKALFTPPLPPKKKALFPPPLPPKKKALFPPPLPPKKKPFPPPPENTLRPLPLLLPPKKKPLPPPSPSPTAAVKKEAVEIEVPPPPAPFVPQPVWTLLARKRKKPSGCGGRVPALNTTAAVEEAGRA